MQNLFEKVFVERHDRISLGSKSLSESHVIFQVLKLRTPEIIDLVAFSNDAMEVSFKVIFFFFFFFFFFMSTFVFKTTRKVIEWYHIQYQSGSQLRSAIPTSGSLEGLKNRVM